MNNLKSPTSWRQMVVGVGIVYALSVAWMTLPASLQLSQRLIGNNIDNWIFYWNNWWLERAISDGQNWFFTPYLFYPQGTSLVAHSNSFLSSLLALPLKPWVGPVAAYNLVFLFGLWVGAVGMFLLVYDDTHHSPAALLAGFIFSFAPYHLTQLLAHTHLGSIHWWPWYALFLRRALRRKRVVDALLGGLFAALTVWTGLQLAVLLALWTVVYVGGYLLRERRSWLRTIGAISLVGIVALALSTPMILPVIESRQEWMGEVATVNEGAKSQTDLLAYLLPPTYNPLAGPHVVALYERFVANKAHMPYLGYTVLGLALVSLLWRRKTATFWLLSAGLWMILAAGSTLRVNGTLHPQVPLPYRFVAHTFPISTLRAPDRLNLLLVFSLAASAGLGAAYLARRRRWLLVPLALLVIAEYVSIPLPAWDLPPVSPLFGQMAQQETTYGVADYPMGYTLSKLWLYYQTLHGKPMVEGHVSRYTRADYAFIASDPLLHALYQAAETPPYVPRHALDDQATTLSALGPALRSLERAGVRYILLHKPYLDAELQAHFHRVLPVAPAYEDTVLAVYDIAHPLPVCYDSLPVSLTADVALVRFDVRHDSASSEWQFEIVAASLAPRIRPHTCEIQLIGERGSATTSAITLFKELPDGTAWETGDLDNQRIPVELPQGLEPGAYRWTAACSEETAYTAPETLRVHTDGRITYVRHSTDIRYGEEIELQGYRWRTEGSELQITLWWKALEPPATDYKVFVHLLDADGEIVRQHDAVPCDWQCPTGQWQAGEVVLDRTSISLGGLSPGEYHLATGLYDAQTLERPPARDLGDRRIPDDYFIFPDAFVISAWGPGWNDDP
jgi:hypothetical protein